MSKLEDSGGKKEKSKLDDLVAPLYGALSGGGIFGAVSSLQGIEETKTAVLQAQLHYTPEVTQKVYEVASDAIKEFTYLGILFGAIAGLGAAGAAYYISKAKKEE